MKQQQGCTLECQTAARSERPWMARQTVARSERPSAQWVTPSALPTSVQLLDPALSGLMLSEPRRPVGLAPKLELCTRN